MGYRPKRPSEILAEITAQYEERAVDRWGQERRGGPGKKKGKNFFQVCCSTCRFITLNYGQGTSDVVRRRI